MTLSNKTSRNILECIRIMFILQGELPPSEALKALTIFEGKFSRLKEERDNIAKAKKALELAEPGWYSVLV